MCTYCLLPWLSPSQAVLRYVMYFRIYGWRHVFTWREDSITAAALPHRFQPNFAQRQLPASTHTVGCNLHSSGEGEQSLLCTIALCVICSKPISRASVAAERERSWWWRKWRHGQSDWCLWQHRQRSALRCVKRFFMFFFLSWTFFRYKNVSINVEL